MESLLIDEPNYLRWGLASPDRAMLLEHHRELCRSFTAGGLRSVAGLPVEQVNRLSVIAWGFLWPAVHACLFRAAAGSFRAEDARRQRNRPTPRRLDGGAL